MFELDIRTLSFVTVLFSFIAFVTLFWIGHVSRAVVGARSIANAILAIGAGFMLLSLRNLIPDWVSIVFANTLIGLGFALIVLGFSRFLGTNPREARLALGLLLLLPPLLVYNTYFQHSVNLRILWMSLFITLTTALCARVLLAKKSPSDSLPTAQHATALVFILTSGFYLLRAAWSLSGPEIQSFMQGGLIQQAALLVAIFLVITTCFGMFWMITERFEEKLRDQAVTDSLTGAFNRHGLADIATREIHRAERYGHPLSLLMLDLDHFKRVNDEHGHQTGDEILSGLGALLQEHLREHDLVVRYGGEEFLILLPNTDLEQATTVAEKLRGTVEATPLSQLATLHCSASLGVAELQPGESWESLIKRADTALYEAKRTGRNRVVNT